MPEIADGVKESAATLSRITGPVRDLDMFLLNRDEYLALVPRALQGDLDRFFTRLRNERTRALKVMLAAWPAGKADAGISALAQRIDLYEPCPETPVPDLAGAVAQAGRIGFRKVLRRSRNKIITGPSNDEALHDLRISVKKLRYLVESFGAVFERSTLERFIRRFARAHNRLGKVTDLEAHTRFLAGYLRAAVISRDRPGAAMRVAALGALWAALDAKRLKAKQDAIQVVKKLRSAKTRSLARRLFGEFEEEDPAPETGSGTATAETAVKATVKTMTTGTPSGEGTPAGTPA
jgi:CHAD domain-containing protein